MTTLLTMGAQGSAMILAILVLRALLLNRLPKATFCVLWILVAFRLLIPLFVANPLGLWGLISRPRPHSSYSGETLAATSATISPPSASASAFSGVPPQTTAASELVTPAVLPNALDPTPSSAVPWWAWVWIAGSILCFLGFTILYLRGRIRFRASLPVDCPQASRWLLDHPLRRPLSIRHCATVSAPLTYGILRPVILVPPTHNWSDSRTTDFVLAHEYAHVARLDALRKLILALAVCVHWFNPLVWLMYSAANRDIELSCDARVARHLAPEQRASYARTLLQSSVPKNSSAMPLTSTFAKSPVEERVVSIVRYRPTSWAGCIASIAVVIAVPTALATSAPSSSTSFEPVAIPIAAGVNTGIAVEGRPVTSHEYTNEEWAALEMLYRYARLGEPITSSLPSSVDISSFRRAIPAALDGLDAEDLLTRLAGDGWLQRQIGSNSLATFLELALVPLASESWEHYQFTGARSVGEPARGVLIYSFSFGYEPKSLEALTGSSGELESLSVGSYLAQALTEWCNLHNLIDGVDPAELSHPDRVMATIDNQLIPSLYGVPYQQRSLDVSYSYQALADNGSWQASSLVGTLHVVPNLENPGSGPKQCDHELEAGTIDAKPNLNTANPLRSDPMLLSYEPFGITRDPVTGKLFYEGEPVRLFIDGYVPGVPSNSTSQIIYYYADPEGTLDLCTEFDYFGNTPIDSSVGQAFQEFRTPIYGIVEMDEEEARSVVELCSPLYEQAWSAHTTEELYGPSGQDPEASAAFDTNLPAVSSLLAMEPSQLLGWLENNGYAYDEDEKAFRRNGGILGDAATGTLQLRVLGEPDQEGYRGLGPEQLDTGETVGAISVELLFAPSSTIPAPTTEEAQAVIELLERRERLANGVSQGIVAETPENVFDAVAYQANGAENILFTCVMSRYGELYGIMLGSSSVEYLAEAYHVNATLESLAPGALWLAPYHTNPEVTTMLEAQGR